jgi:UDP-N-acetylmuramoyl-tripeptide--D-alanyl-D-alanine ligase
VHLELPGTIEAVAEAKAELIAALPGGGLCVVPAAAEAIRPHLRQHVRTLTFANWPRSDDGALEDLEVAGAAADIRVLEAKAVRTSGGAPGLRAEIAILAERSLFVFNFGQAHNLVNALAAIGAARALGVPVPEMAQGARQVAFSSMRGEEIELSDGALIINDTYNANPISMRAALDHLATVAEQRRNARSVAVLGEMAELGAEAARFHREVGEHAARRGVALVLAVGALAEAYAEGYGDAGEVQRASDATEAAAILREAIDRNDVVLIKGSRAVGLERVTDSLVRRDAEGGT